MPFSGYHLVHFNTAVGVGVLRPRMESRPSCSSMSTLKNHNHIEKAISSRSLSSSCVLSSIKICFLFFFKN